MKKIYTELDISAPQSQIWERLMDFETWPEWNPIVFKFDGQAKVGTSLNITMTNSNGKAGRAYQAQITNLNAPLLFSFKAKMMANFLFSVERNITLSADKDSTKLVQEEIYTGLMVPLFWKKLNHDATLMLNAMNNGLKSAVEK